MKIKLLNDGGYSITLRDAEFPLIARGASLSTLGGCYILGAELLKAGAVSAITDHEYFFLPPEYEAINED